jgi:hypothetical protein
MKLPLTLREITANPLRATSDFRAVSSAEAPRLGAAGLELLELEVLGGGGAVCAVATIEAVSREKKQSGAIKKLWMCLSKEKNVVRRTAVRLAGAIYYFAFFGQAGMLSTICLGTDRGFRSPIVFAFSDFSRQRRTATSFGKLDAR